MFVSRTTELAWHVINKKEIKFQGPDSSRKEGRLATTRTDPFGGLPSAPFTFTKLLTAKAFLNFGKFGQFRIAVDAAGRADHCPPYHAIGLLRAALSRPIGGVTSSSHFFTPANFRHGDSPSRSTLTRQWRGPLARAH